MISVRAQDGFTLVEVLAAVTLFVVVLLPVLGMLESHVTRSDVATQQSDAQDRARTAVDRLARELRNLASPTSADVRSIDRAEGYDLIFKTADPAKRRVRYCMVDGGTGTGALWQQTQTLALSAPDPGVPASTSCPAPVGAGGWGTRVAVVADVANTLRGDRPVFAYTGLGADGETSRITAIRPHLYLDVNPGVRPPETTLSTGVFLRNQNQMPILSDFSLVQSPPGSRTFAMNGSQASDPEGRTLEYQWFEVSGTTATPIGRGLTLTHSFGPGSGVRSVRLKVVDPGGLSATVTKQTPPLP